MAIRKKKKKQQEQQDDELLVDIGQVGQDTSDFIDRNQTQIFGGLTLLVLLIGGYLAYQNFYVKPQQTAVIDKMSQAQFQFERDSFAAALTNPGAGFPGLLEIIEDYGGTEAGNLANYYAGVSYLNLGQFDGAITYLNDFSANGRVMPIMKNGALGDAYAEKGDLAQALSYYQKAANAEDNEALTPYYLKKAAMLSEKQGDKAAALKMYEQIKSKYPLSADASDIDKYISRTKG
jgi:TolA-binding protein